MTAFTPASSSTSSCLETRPTLQGTVDGLPNICGWDTTVQEVTRNDAPVFLPRTNLQLDGVSAGFAIALHMHQPTIPAGAAGELISHLQYMFEHTHEGDNHNAGSFAYCYSRTADFISDLVSQGHNPRVMLDYSGNLLWGFQNMGRTDILDNLKRITCDPDYQPYVEWLGTMWSHSVVPTTPLPDIKLHIQAWQHHFASLFGWEALGRVKGFSPPEMGLPNHPDALYAFVDALLDCGYRWVLLQEHTVETLTGQPLVAPHLPHRLVAKNAHGDTRTITALIKTQGSDTKLVGQMQPYYEAKTLSRCTLGGVSIPPLVTQISDGENGGVMMNEFPAAFRNAWYDMGQSRQGTVGMTGTEYLELIADAGCSPDSYPHCQAVGQHRIWERVDSPAPDAVAEAIAAVKQDDPNFSMDGGSWTNHISWTEGYQNVLSPMNDLSARFHQAIAPLNSETDLTRQHRYRNALLHNLLLQTSCFRYWGQGAWTGHAEEIYRRGCAILEYDF